MNVYKIKDIYFELHDDSLHIIIHEDNVNGRWFARDFFLISNVEFWKLIRDMVDLLVEKHNVEEFKAVQRALSEVLEKAESKYYLR